MNFKPLSGMELYSSIIGANPACIECGDSAPAMDCTTGNYCGDDLCQPCDLPEHCGASCQKCPADKAICSAGKCVQCTSDAMCPAGGSCDIASGTCLPPAPCTSSAQCKAPQVCLPDGFCGNPPQGCKIDSECLAGQLCTCEDYSTSCTQKVCIVPPTQCRDDAACDANYHCDTEAQICRMNDRYMYEGGLVGCSVGGGELRRGGGLAWLAMLGLSLLSFWFRGRRRLQS